AAGGHGVVTSVFGLALVQPSTALRLQDDRCEQRTHGVGVHALSRYRNRDEDIQQGAALGRSCRHEHEVTCGGVVKAAVGLDPSGEDATGLQCGLQPCLFACAEPGDEDRKSTRLNSSHVSISYAVFCLKKKIKT